MKKLMTICAVVAIVLAVSGVSQAALEIRVDFGKQPAVTTSNWTSIDDGNKNVSTSNLVDFISGLPTTVSTIGNSWGSFSYAEPWSSAEDWVVVAASTDGYAGGSTGVSTQTFSGLDSQKNYKVEVVSAYGSSNFGTVTLTINGVYADTNYDNTMAGNVSQNWNQLSAFNNQDWMIWSSIAPNTNGELVISLKNDSNNWGILNAVRITEVPEPATLALLGLGGVMSLISRKRKTA